MWEIDFAEQIKSFFYSIILGGIFGLLYDTFQIPLKRKGVSPIAVFIADIIYFVIIGITNFLFLLGVSKGEIRGYLLIGAAFGFFLYKKTLSRPIGFIFFIVTKPVRLLFFWLNKVIFAFSNQVYDAFYKIGIKIAEIIKKILKKA